METDLGSIPGNFRIAHDQITDKVRVSTMAIFRENWFGPWWLVETWIFSEEPAQKDRQILHGEYTGRQFNPDSAVGRHARQAHASIAFEMRKKFVWHNLLKDAHNFAAALLKKNNE